jgi:Extensin-like protein C-terminus
MRTSVCARFTTVLGPGADGYHEDHIHVDLAERRGGYRICQWDIRDLSPDADYAPATGSQRHSIAAAEALCCWRNANPSESGEKAPVMSCSAWQSTHIREHVWTVAPGSAMP